MRFLPFDARKNSRDTEAVLSIEANIRGTERMSKRKPRYHRRRFPPEIISYAIWLYHRFNLNFRDIEDVLAERGIEVSYEAIRRWYLKFGPDFRGRLKRRKGPLGDTWRVDEASITILGQVHDFWRAVDQDGDVVDILAQQRRNAHAAKRFFAKALKGQGDAPSRLTTDKLSSHPPAIREVMPETVHDTSQYANNRAELSHQPTRERERQISAPSAAFLVASRASE